MQKLTGINLIYEKDIKGKDAYGRTLGYVYLPSGEFVNELLVQEGYAKVRQYPPNTHYHKKLLAAQQTAKKLKKGLWNKKQTASSRAP
jgi:micrococcal nuclease